VKLFNYNNEELTVKVQNLTTLYKRIYLIFYLLKNNIKPLEHYTLITLVGKPQQLLMKRPKTCPSENPIPLKTKHLVLVRNFPLYI
jgi:hypothetical protein